MHAMLVRQLVFPAAMEHGARVAGGGNGRVAGSPEAQTDPMDADQASAPDNMRSSHPVFQLPPAPIYRSNPESSGTREQDLQQL